MGPWTPRKLGFRKAFFQFVCGWVVLSPHNGVMTNSLSLFVCFLPTSLALICLSPFPVSTSIAAPTFTRDIISWGRGLRASQVSAACDRSSAERRVEISLGLFFCRPPGFLNCFFCCLVAGPAVTIPDLPRLVAGHAVTIPDLSAYPLGSGRRTCRHDPRVARGRARRVVSSAAVTNSSL